MSPIMTVFILVFIGQLVTWIGKAVLLDYTYDAYLRISRSPVASRQRELKSQIMTTKSELMKTSAQDQFAKWAKLRRSVDKGLSDLEKLNSEIVSAKSGFSIKFNTTLWLLTTGLQFAVGWWYRNTPMFYLPQGWFGPVGWWLALPFAPAGSVSVGVWQMACRRVIVVGERVTKDLYSPSSASSTEPSRKASGAAHAPTPNNTPKKPSEKKES